jgi:FeS assembly protein IscX
MSPAMDDTFSWTDVEDIAIALAETYPDVDPLSVRFTKLREMVESLDDFEAVEGHPVNEQILEAIQAAWHEEAQDQNDNEDEDGGIGYKPMNPFKPEE